MDKWEGTTVTDSSSQSTDKSRTQRDRTSAFVRVDSPREYRSTLCTSGLLTSCSPGLFPKNMSSRYSMQSQGPKMATHSRGNVASDRRSLLKDFSDEASMSPDVSPKKRNRRALKDLISKVVSARDSEAQEATPYFILHYDSGNSNESLSPGKRKKSGDSSTWNYEHVPDQDQKRAMFVPHEKVTQEYSENLKVQNQATSGNRKGTSTTWPSPHRAVAEGNNEDVSSAAKSQRSFSSGGSHLAPEVVLAMKSLVRKQQKSIEEMEKENRLFREELQEYRKMLTKAKHDRSQQEDKIGLLKKDEASSDSQTSSLRDETRKLKYDVGKMKESQPTMSHNIQSIGSLTYSTGSSTSRVPLPYNIESKPEISHFDDRKKAIYGNFRGTDFVRKPGVYRRKSDSIFYVDDKWDDSTISEHEPLEVGSSTYSPRDASDAARSKNEVKLFKSRLEAIQKRREDRKKQEGGLGSRSGRVRFD